jgi:cyclase
VTGSVPAPRLASVRGSCHAWIQPDGGWGLSNSGLVVGAGASLLVDTLFDLAHTRRMLDGFADLTAGRPISTVVNTHGNGDHWFGNELVPEAEVIASAASDGDMRDVGPANVQKLLEAPGVVGSYGRTIFGAFDFHGISPRYADRTYTEELDLVVGGVELRLLDLGPAHTAGDTVVFCERDAVVFTGDLLFAGGTPIVWDGPIENWLTACRRILSLGATLAVPGHGPVSPIERVRDMADYLEFIREEATVRHDRGMPSQDAARDIDLGVFGGWPEAERLAANVACVYRELSGPDAAPAGGPALFGCMADLHAGWA